MVFEPAESRTDALAEAEQHFIYRAQRARTLKARFFEKFHLLRPQLALVYYPLWVVRYEYNGRHYQVVVDGVKGKVLYGKAPGNSLYRAAALVAGLATGNLILVNGPILFGWLLSGSDDGDGFWLVILPIVIGLGLIAAGYRAFRYGEEVEQLQKENKKASLGHRSKMLQNLPSELQNKDFAEFLQTGLGFIEEMAEIDPSRYRRKRR
jgi:hypothetical protein